MALSDTQQSILMFVATALITLNVYVATLPETPGWVIGILGGAAAIAVVAKEQFGARKAEVATRTTGGTT